MGHCGVRITLFIDYVAVILGVMVDMTRFLKLIFII